MTAKQYLQQAFRLNERIETNRLEVERLRGLAAVQSLNVSKDSGQTRGISDQIGNIVAKIVDFEVEINAEIDRFVELKKEIRDRIQGVADDNLRLILQKRYINFQKWEQIAIDMNYNYRWVLRLHRQALNAFSEKYMN